MFEFLRRDKSSSTGSKIYWRNNKGEISCNGDECMNHVCPTDCPIKLNTDGIERLMIERYDEAISYFKKAAEIAPDFSDVWNNMGSCYGNLGKHKEALEMFTKAYELGHKKTALFGMVIANKSLGNKETALKLCDEYEQKFSDGQCSKIKRELS